MAAGEAYTAFVHGSKAGDAKTAPAAIVCRTYLSIDERAAAGDYAIPAGTDDKGQPTAAKFISESCFYGDK